jgi:dipeptidase E
MNVLSFSLRLFAAVFVSTALPATAAPSFRTSPQASVLVIGGSMMAGNHFSDPTLPAMRNHFQGCRTVALVLHASHPSERDRMEARLQEAFVHLGGLQATSLHRRDAAGAIALLEKADAIFVGGGETFVLLGELHRTGQLEVIRRRVLAGVPYGGTSAGANVAGLVIGTTNDFPVADIPSREALGIFPAVINPHHPETSVPGDFSARSGKIRVYLQFNPTETVLALGNAAIARLHQGRIEFLVGSGWIYRADGVRALAPGDAAPEMLR